MKHSALAFIAAIFFIFSCSSLGSDESGKNKEFNGVPILESEIPKAILGRWEVDDKNSKYAFFEFTEDGYYIILERKQTSNSLILSKSSAETNLGITHFGKYRVDGMNIVLEDFGEIANIQLDANTFRLSFVVAGSTFVTTETGNLYTGAAVEILCRPWLLEKVTSDPTGEVAIPGAISDAVAMWSKSGTYMVVYESGAGLGSDKKIGLSEWEWTPDTPTGTSFDYSWKNWDGSAKANGLPTTVEIIILGGLNGDSLVVKEDSRYYFFNLLKVTSSTGNIGDNLQEGKIIYAQDAINNPAIVNATCTYNWSNGATGDSYTLKDTDIGNEISVTFNCGTYGTGTGTFTGGQNNKVIPLPPTISIAPITAYYDQGSTASLTATTANATRVEWYNSANEKVGEGNPYTFTITNEGDAEFYAMAIREVNDVSSATRSNNAMIRVLTTPTATASPASQICEVGMSCVITCTAGNLNSGTISGYEWFKDGVSVATTTANTFDATNAADGDAGYSCKATNSRAGVTDKVSEMSNTITIKYLSSVLKCEFPINSLEPAGAPFDPLVSCTNAGIMGDLTWANNPDWNNPAMGNYNNITVTATCEGVEQTATCNYINFYKNLENTDDLKNLGFYKVIASSCKTIQLYNASSIKLNGSVVNLTPGNWYSLTVVEGDMLEVTSAIPQTGCW